MPCTASGFLSENITRGGKTQHSLITHTHTRKHTHTHTHTCMHTRTHTHTHTHTCKHAHTQTHTRTCAHTRTHTHTHTHVHTQIWPHKEYHLIPVGKMVLDRNPKNYFAKVEQMAFEPSNMPPGRRLPLTKCCRCVCHSVCMGSGEY